MNHEIRWNQKHANVVTVAIARALAGFVWAIAKEVPVTL